jgi:Bacterial Ig-like domain (group 3)
LVFGTRPHRAHRRLAAAAAALSTLAALGTQGTASAGSPPSVSTQPSDTTVCAGATASFTSTATGSPAPTVQWQVSTDGGSTFTPINGATSTTYSFTATAAMNGYQYEAVFTNGNAPDATSNVATLTVSSTPVITTNPTAQYVFAGESVTFDSAATDTPTPTVQWQFSTNNGVSFNNVPSATSPSYTHNAPLTENQVQFQAVYTDINTSCTATTTPAILTVIQEATSTAVASSANPAFPTESITFTATVTKVAASPGGGQPVRQSATALAGNVQFVVDGSNFGPPVAVTVALDGSGSATSGATSWANATGSPHTVSATYANDNNFVTSTGNLLNGQAVGQTTTTVTSSANPAAVGQSVTFTAAVASLPPGGAVPTGTVQFSVDSAGLGGSIPLDVNGHAVSPAISWPGPGSHIVTAIYTTNSTTYTGSQGTMVPNQAVGQILPTVKVSLPPMAPVVYGQPVTFTALVTVPVPASGTPTGTVTFVLDGNPSFTATVNPGTVANTGVATWPNPGINAKGNHTITATYNGDPNFFPNSSPPLNFPVGFPPSGYFLSFDDGYVTPFGSAVLRGSMGGQALNAPIVGIATTPKGLGYWLVASDGGIFSFGNATFHGSTGNLRLNAPIVGIAAAPDGNGYWMVASDGGVFSFGSARFHGSMGAVRLNKPVVGMAAAPDGNGYWLVASDGGIFSFGSARFHGSTGNLRLNKPVVGMAATPSGNGYWMVATDGGVFAFGDAGFFGSTGSLHLVQPVTGMARTVDGAGYWMCAADGGIFTFGDAVYYGSTGLDGGPSPDVGMASMSISG